MKNRVRITKEFSFEMSHLLTNHLGGCKNIHGHSYKFFVTIIGTPNMEEGNPQNGMLIDFGELKKIINRLIVHPLDHALMVSKSSYEGTFLEQYTGKVIVKNFEPTCENLVSEFAAIIKNELPEHVQLHSLKLYETATSYTEWFHSDN
ncbi:MAG: 6-carboxytetrahydropterin synthase [Salinivirgaceae bacterium]|nr:6-carboxytetrahydropterin synthase [Salinivirgaceae bacterium]MDD4746211.1 6-carboxytetrahydropterin synthase [Salinivirgaceae bacterium]MDY0279372.1 6-carboxytetrahydropterin synthase [Salinivirgaceae bacterium]